jgi:chromosome partitioning protein
MAKVIALVGSKGGSGKSTAAHLIAHGCGSLARPIPTIVLTTDPEEHPRTDRRRYAVADGRTRDALLSQMRKLLQVERLLILLDGAAARPDLDQVVSEVADLAVLPFKPAAQDVERAADNLKRLPTAVALPMDWPALPATAKRVRRYLNAVPEDRRLPPFKHIPRLSDLLGEGYAEAAYDLASPARGLALEVLARAGIDPDDLTEPR